MKKTKSFILSLALVGGMTAFVNAQEENQQQQQQQMQMQQQNQQDIDVEDEELEQFASVYQGVMKKNQKAQEEMVDAIKKEGLTVEDYQKMREADNNPEADQDIPEADLKKKENIDNKIKEMEPMLQKEQTDIIEDSDLSVDRYQEIAMALRSDQDLQQKLQQILMDQDGGQ